MPAGTPCKANLGILAQDHAIELIQSRAQSFARQGATVKDAIIVAIGNLQHQVATGSVLAARIAQSGPGTPTFISVLQPLDLGGQLRKLPLELRSPLPGLGRNRSGRITHEFGVRKLPFGRSEFLACTFL